MILTYIYINVFFHISTKPSTYLIGIQHVRFPLIYYIMEYILQFCYFHETTIEDFFFPIMENDTLFHISPVTTNLPSPWSSASVHIPHLCSQNQITQIPNLFHSHCLTTMYFRKQTWITTIQYYCCNLCGSPKHVQKYHLGHKNLVKNP